VKKLLPAAVALCAAAALALTGCASKGESVSGNGNSAPAAKPVDPKIALVSAVQKTAGQTSAKVTMTMTMGTTKVNADGVMKYTAPITGDLTMRMTGPDGQPMTMHAVYTPDAMYMSVPQFTAQIGKKWLRMRYADLAGAGGGAAFGKVLQQQMQQGQDPRQWLKVMTASQDLKVVGTETIGGTSTTHYRGTVDTVKALAAGGQLTSLTAAERSALQKQFAALKLQKFDADAWIGADGWPRRIEERAKLPQGAFHVRIDMSDFGVAVKVTPPPAAQVQDFGALLKSGG
jgi:hypothetical protein